MTLSTLNDKTNFLRIITIQTTQLNFAPVVDLPIYYIASTSISYFVFIQINLINIRDSNNQIINTITIDIACITDTLTAMIKRVSTPNDKTGLSINVSQIDLISIILLSVNHIADTGVMFTTTVSFMCTNNHIINTITIDISCTADTPTAFVIFFIALNDKTNFLIKIFQVHVLVKIPNCNGCGQHLRVVLTIIHLPTYLTVIHIRGLTSIFIEYILQGCLVIVD